MNSIFQIGAKLVGIIFLTRGIIGISYFGQIFSLTEEVGSNYVIGIIATLLSVTANIAFSLLLIFKTNSVEKIIGVDKLKEKTPEISSESGLRIGVILVGLYYVVIKSPTIFRYVYQIFTGRYELIHIAVFEIIIFLLAISFIFCTESVLKVIQRK